VAGSRDFHGRCDGYASTLALIQDRREREQFRGFTLEFGSQSNLQKANPNSMRFRFRLKNPHNFAFPFALKTAKNDHALHCYPSAFPLFDQRVFESPSAWENDSHVGCEDLQRLGLLPFP
jgi:hypothetical protein